MPDKDGKLYHAIFDGTSEEYQAFIEALTTNGPDFWVMDKTRAAFLELNKELFRCHLLIKEMNGNLKEVGKKEYFEIGKLRDQLEDCMLLELPSLHKVRQFLKCKTVIKSYGLIDLKKRPGENNS